MRWYVGFNYMLGAKPIAFPEEIEPTEKTHGHRYLAVMGPFRTKKAAIFTATTYPNPHVQTVADAERIVKQFCYDGSR